MSKLAHVEYPHKLFRYQLLKSTIVNYYLDEIERQQLYSRYIYYI